MATAEDVEERDVECAQTSAQSDAYSTVALVEAGLASVPEHYLSPSGAYDPRLVRSLVLDRNQLVALPAELARFRHLVALDVSNNALVELPAALCRLERLRELQLRNNQLECWSMPKNLERLAELQVLNLGGNRFDRLPPSVVDLPQLRALYLGANRIEQLPCRIGDMQSLEILYLGGNRLREIPATIGRLRNLSSLVLCDNRLETIPSTIANLQRLESLSLHTNKLQTLPPEIVKLRNLDQLSLRNNPLVGQFVRDMAFNPPTLKELAARAVKIEKLDYKTDNIIPASLFCYMDSANQCINPKCKGVYFEARVEHVKFVDFCGKYRVPLLQFLCSTRCSSSPAYAFTSATDSSESDGDVDDDALPSGKMQKVLLG